MIHDDLIAGITLTLKQYKARHKARRAVQKATPEAKEQIKVRRKVKDLVWRAKPEKRARIIANRTGTPIEIPNCPPSERCQCCGEIPAHTLHLDHCHDSGRFRGWCCCSCNTGHGIMDNPKRLRLRALYLERPFQVGPIKWAYPKGWHVALDEDAKAALKVADHNRYLERMAKTPDG